MNSYIDTTTMYVNIILITPKFHHSFKLDRNPFQILHGSSDLYLILKVGVDS